MELQSAAGDPPKSGPFQAGLNQSWRAAGRASYVPPWTPGSGAQWQPLRGRPKFRSVEACEREEWTLVTWRKDKSEEPVASPLLCKSWRCRRCAKWRGAIDWARVSKAVTSRPWWLYVVLTFDPADCRDKWDAYRVAGARWDHGLRRSIERQIAGFVAELFGPTEDRLVYLQTWERHASGWPHCNVMISSDRLQTLVEAWGVERRQHGKRGRFCLFPKRWRRWFREKAVAAGFGRSVWVEVIDQSSHEAMANYLLKIAKELTGATDKKGNQSPLDAPRHFRRIRASHKLLPPPPKGSGEWTGHLFRSPIARELLDTSGIAPRPSKEPGECPAATRVSFGTVELWLQREADERARHWALPPKPLDPLNALLPELEEVEQSLENQGRHW